MRASESPERMSTTEKELNSQRPEYWSTLSEYEQDEEYLSRVGEEFYPSAKPERFFEAGENPDEKLISPIKRRTFLKLSGFAALAAAIQGCERPVHKVLPYVSKPEEVVYGKSNYYASTSTATPESLPLLVNSREGRPIKLEGNPDYLPAQGTLDARTQASILDLYNPDRLRFPIRVKRNFTAEVGEGLEPNEADSIEGIDKEIGDAIRNAAGKVVVLTPSITGPSNERLIKDFLKQGANFEHVSYDPLISPAEAEANEIAFGTRAIARMDFEKADVVVALGGDPLAQGVTPVTNTIGFSKRRKPDNADGMSRVYAFEPVPTLLGMKADYRYPVRPDQLVSIGLALINTLLYGDAQYRVANAENYTANDAIRRLVTPYTATTVGSETGVGADEIRRVAASLAAHPGHSIISTNGTNGATQDALALHLVGNLLNAILGNYGTTLDLTERPARSAATSLSSIDTLCADMRAGRVDVLILSGVNPVYTLPADYGFAEGMSKVKTIVSLDMMMNESAAASDYAVPAVHGLESWGDAEPIKGVYTIQQPIIRTIFGELAKNQAYFTRPWQDSLIAFASAAGSDVFTRKPEAPAVSAEDAATTDTAAQATPTGPYTISWREYVRETWRTSVFEIGDFAATDFDDFWTGVLQKGILTVPVSASGDTRFSIAAVSRIPAPERKSGTVLVAYATACHGDGNSMGNPHLLELPDPVSKVAWDNYAAISPDMAREMGVKDGQYVRLTAGSREIEVPAYIQPGQVDGVIAVMLGWGRNTFGGVGDGLGGNAYSLLSRSEAGPVFSGISISADRIGKRTELANVQGHNYLYSPSHAGIKVNAQHGDIPENTQKNEQGKPVYDRPIIGETTLDEWKADPYSGYPNHVDPGKKPKSIWEGTHKYAGHHWGMAVDLNACTGCNACIVACSIENNVPVVGKEEVLIGREMHWMRLDRYYRGDKKNPDFVTMPLMCQHCDNAPCETVCPVIATMHNDEGLNVMTYNRCVGTRYCANNCPYKVRRFNFWQYSDYRTGPHDGVKRVAPLELVLNPDITTRTRGVMEKCTFCVGRIRHAKEDAREKGRPLQDGDMKTACQQTCPAQAIVFGDRNDPNSEVAKLWKDPRAYGLLEDLTTDPSVRYMTLVRNRDEPSPYRTKYQAHRMHAAHGEGHGAAHGDAHGNGHGEDTSHDGGGHDH